MKNIKLILFIIGLFGFTACGVVMLVFWYYVNTLALKEHTAPLLYVSLITSTLLLGFFKDWDKDEPKN
jgi:hypothetical protein